MVGDEVGVGGGGGSGGGGGVGVSFIVHTYFKVMF